MDEQLKARLVGATILVLLAVLLIPELLSGRKQAESGGEPAEGAAAKRTYTIELGGQGSVTRVESAQTPPAAERDSGQSSAKEPDPEPVAATAAEGEQPAEARVPAQEPAAVAEQPPAEPAPQAASPAVEAAPAAAPSGAWAVQVGAFGSEGAARQLAQRLEKQDYDVFVVKTTRSGKTLHRVRVGPVATRGDADRLASSLKSAGLPAAIVAND
jgi:cell division septation protein DedD